MFLIRSDTWGCLGRFNDERWRQKLCFVCLGVVRYHKTKLDVLTLNEITSQYSLLARVAGSFVKLVNNFSITKKPQIGK